MIEIEINVKELLDTEEVEDFYSTIFTTKEKFAHKVNPDNPTKADLLNEAIYNDEYYSNTLICYLSGATSSFICDIDSFIIYASNTYDREEVYNEHVKSMVEERIHDTIGKDGIWLKYYIDEDSIIDDYKEDLTYADVLSCDGAEYECKIDGITFYVYRVY